MRLETNVPDWLSGEWTEEQTVPDSSVEPQEAAKEEEEAAPPPPPSAPPYAPPYRRHAPPPAPAGPMPYAPSAAPSPFGTVTPQEIVLKLIQIGQYVISLRNQAWNAQLIPFISEGDMLFIEIQRIIMEVENPNFLSDTRLQTAAYDAVQSVITRVATYENGLREAYNMPQPEVAAPEPVEPEPEPEPEPEAEPVSGHEPPKPDRVAVLLAALHDEKEWVQQGAAQALGELRDPSSVEPLIEALADPNEKVRFYATVALGLIGDGRAVAAIRRLRSDVNVNVRKVAEWALSRLPGS